MRISGFLALLLFIQGGVAMASDIYVTVGVKDAEIIGRTNKALQAAVDYVAALGGGTVEIGPGEYWMENSLHLRSNVTVRGQDEATVLKKCDGLVAPLILDGDYGEEQFTVADPSGFKVGMGVSVFDDDAGGFHTVVATIIAADGNTFRIDKPILADCMVRRNARAQTTFPVISGYYIENARVENLTVDGNGDKNPYLNGCRGAGIFLYRAHGTHIAGCTTRNYHGDGISFQQSNDVVVEDCVSYDNTHLGLHPGSGSQRPTIRRCRSYRNNLGLFLCWRVKNGVFEENELFENATFGISIGHKDTDNLFRKNVIRSNRRYGVYFRNESEAMAGHRNRFEENVIEDNGNPEEGAGVVIDGETHDITFVQNTITDTRPEGEKMQRYGVWIKEKASRVTLTGNQIRGNIESTMRNDASPESVTVE